MKGVEVIILDWKEFSGDAFNDFRKHLAKFGLHLGDAEEEYYGRVMSDTYHLYISKKTLTKKQLNEVFNFEGD